MPVPVPVLAPTVAADIVPVTFRDKAFRSRTLVFADGSTLAVERSTVTATDEEQIALLERHPDFERVADGS
ncbi:hypothetical protein [Paraburkholderia terricola]|uniref:hypothetical protein n=1 Tax=Paraburkholderia terricola TaxID=169427 RepID=UPI000DEF5704|nr:hypothetical protein [Paraburkholderia terricola]AXE92865.1 hypothetical protein CUJ90_11360 [Paraburkholderia terricola]